MFSRIWTLKIIYYYLTLLQQQTLGSPIWSQRETEILSTNWTEMADEWIKAKDRIAERISITLLPSNNKIHELPPISPSFIFTNSVDVDQLTRMNYSRMLWDMEYSQKSGHLSLFVDKAMKLLDLRQVMTEVETSVMSKVSCTACKVGAGLLQHFIKAGKSEEEILNSIFQFCVSLKIQSVRVCQGITLLMGGEVIYVLKEVEMSSAQICSFVIGDACEDVYNPLHDWEVVFPPVNKPTIKPPVSPLEGAPNFKVLHISDTHYDPYYQEGTNAECNEPLCCRLTNGPALTPSAAAGKWGDYRKCDTPKRTVDHMLNHIAATHPDIDYIIWTGDLPPHDVWNQTRDENLKILRDTVKQMVKTFPGVPIFPSLGNHESAPVNSYPPPFAPEDNSIAWLYNELDEQWRQWLPAGTSNTVKRGAFYSVLVRPGFRILSVNTNYCNNKNWWLLMNSTDPVSELQWLIYELQGAEINNEKVHIIGHIPPGHSDCLKVWSRNYYHIINRYESTITAQFFGHTHYDEFEVFYDTADLGRALSIAYIGPSVSPYYDLNPGYRIYYVDGDHPKTTRMVIDHESWVMNLKEANLYDFPIWYKSYSARQTFQMPSLLPKDWDSLIDKMTNEPNVFDIYYKHYYKNSPVRPLCNDECKKRLLCDLRSGRSHDRKALCQNLETRINGDTKTGWRAWIYNGLALSMSVVMSIPRFAYNLPKYVLGLV
ncbi:sphingomyelin phosphodiesterase isoform X1 [Nasonia vitripennis]|uniref:Sphingomyelin phosphodiesterase n=1 Tax=Nasonia vitripennis TaxID=7425 RepID=A0A7M7R1K6_NASVI|nr:sphingomyelin phosphodiesterase isoform X1 [Nasonia vitripennis]XP_032457943.1 sphingomyelin phosphodiesterase isoform X1 [Nasonia vitripennis]